MDARMSDRPLEQFADFFLGNRRRHAARHPPKYRGGNLPTAWHFK